MNTLRLLTLDIRLEHDVVLGRQRARQLATAFGFDTAEQTRVATAVSEIARNAFEYAKGGRIEFAVETPERPAGPIKQSLLITVRDQGPGLPPVERRRSSKGLGIGLTGAGRLMDGMDIATRPGATAITMRKAFPTGAPVLTSAQLQAAVDRIAAERPTDPLGELQRQNQELVRVLEEVSRREEDLARVNQELADTNTGVLALYDELETLQRVSVLLATQLDLPTLLRAIIDATTELTGAPIGAFYNRDSVDRFWRLQAAAGPAAGVLENFPASGDADLFGEEFLERYTAARETFEPETCACEDSAFVRALAPKFTVRSCLTMPVGDGSERKNALVFCSDRAGAFTERSQRIVASVASQAAIGIEKARLFAAVQSASVAKDRFLAMLSHELRTPLNPVLMAVDEMHDDPALPPAMRETLRMMQRNIALEARLIDDLLDFSRITNGKLQLHLTPLDLHTLVHAVVGICAEEIAAGPHTVVLELQAPRATVLGDSARLQQVLWNLLKNALKFTPPPGRIEIRTSLAGSENLALTVADSGVGIDKARLAGIFGAFEQGGDAVTARFGGLGLGLAITKAFVELHEGRIRAASEGPGQGMQITVELPLLAAETTPDAPVTSTVPTATAHTGTLLLVDDHADTIQIMARLLKRRGYRVLLATDCRSAVEVASQNEFDLIVSDLGLPDGSGLTLLRELRQHRAVPAIALSGYGMEEDRRQSQAAGYDEHLTKPLDFPLLVRAIARLLTAAAEKH